MKIVIAGLIALSLGLWGMVVWWWSVTEFLRGMLPVVLMLLGIVALAAGVARIRDEKAVKDADILVD